MDIYLLHPSWLSEERGGLPVLYLHHQQSVTQSCVNGGWKRTAGRTKVEYGQRENLSKPETDAATSRECA